MRENVSLYMCAQRTVRSGCTFVQTDPCLRGGAVWFVKGLSISNGKDAFRIEEEDAGTANSSADADFASPGPNKDFRLYQNLSSKHTGVFQMFICHESSNNLQVISNFYECHLF